MRSYCRCRMICALKLCACAHRMATIWQCIRYSHSEKRHSVPCECFQYIQKTARNSFGMFVSCVRVDVCDVCVREIDTQYMRAGQHTHTHTFARITERVFPIFLHSCVGDSPILLSHSDYSRIMRLACIILRMCVRVWMSARLCRTQSC